jgi:hypothetical protein
MSDVQDWNRKIIEEFHANEGNVDGPFAGAQSCSFTLREPRPAGNG